MPRGYFDALVPHPTHDRYVLVDSREVDYLTTTGDRYCVIHLKDGQQIETLVSREGIQLMVEQAQRLLQT